MKRTFGWVMLAAMAVMLLAPMTAAAEENNASSGGNVANTPRAFGIVGACLGAGLAAFGGGMAIARIGGNSIDAIARQPEASGAM